MIYHLLNLITSIFIYFGVFYFEIGNINLQHHYYSFFPIYLIISLVFSIYFTPEKYYLKERTYSAILQFVFTLFTLSLMVSLGDYTNIPHYFILLVVDSQKLSLAQAQETS